MPFVLKCQQCDTSFRVPDSANGKWVKCTNCGHKFVAKDEIDFESPPPLPAVNKSQLDPGDAGIDLGSNTGWDVPPISVPVTVPEGIRKQRKRGWIIPFTAGLFTAICILALIYVSFVTNHNGTTEKKVSATGENVADAPVQTPKPKGLIDETESLYASRPSHWKPNGKGSYEHTSGVTVAFNWEREFRQGVNYNQKVVLWDDSEQNQILVAIVVLSNPGHYIAKKEMSDELDSRLGSWLAAGYPGVLSYAGISYEAGPSINGLSSIIISED